MSFVIAYILNIIFHSRKSACLPCSKADEFSRKELTKWPIYLYLLKSIYIFLVLGYI